MKTQLLEGGADHPEDRWLVFTCPGCGLEHGPRVAGTPGRPLWRWNGDRERPTLQPSILVRGSVPLTDAERARVLAGETIVPTPLVCHSFVTDGRIQFLTDSTHRLAGHTVELPDCEW